MEVDETPIAEPAQFQMPEEGERINININYHDDLILPFTINLEEPISNAIGRARPGGNFDLTLKDGTVLDPKTTFREAGVKLGDVFRLVENIDSGIGSMVGNDSSSETPSDGSDCTLKDLDEIESVKEEEMNVLLNEEMNDSGIVMLTGTNGNLTEFPVNKSDTVETIIQRATGTRDNAEFDLYEGPRVLPRNISLRNAGIRFRSNLRLAERQINVFIRCGDGGKTLTVQARRSQPVMYLMERFRDERNVPIHQQRLQFQSKPLKETNTLASYGIKDCSTVDSTFRLRGGAN